MLYFITVVVLIISLINIARKNKKYYLLLLLLLLIFAGNDFNADYLLYERIYNNFSEYNKFEFGYNFLIKIANFMGIKYQGFIIIISLIGFLLIIKALKDKSNINYVLFCYALYPFLLDVTQVRFFLSTAIFINFVPLLTQKNKLSTIKYIFGVLLAASIHMSALVFLIFLIAKMKFKQIFKFQIVFFTIIVTIIIIINGNKIPFINNLMEILSGSKYVVYFESQVRFGFLIPLFYYISSILLLNWSNKTLALRANNEYINSDIISFSKIVLDLHIVSLAFFPLFFINLQFIRFYRSLCLVKYCVFSLTDLTLIKKSKDRYKYNFAVFSFVIINFILELLLQDRFSRVFQTVFQHNIFFK